MKFKYIGAGDNPPAETVAFGYAFKLDGPAVEVDVDAATKLAENKCFRASKPGRPRKSNGTDESGT